MTSPPSSSELDSSNASLLDERIRRWIWSKRWTGLRDAQEAAIPLILAGEDDLIIAAATASGKTEAAFLPILSKLAANGDDLGVALYVSPLKALINDQWSRLESLCETLEIPVTPWHGDIAQSRKHRFKRAPQGVLLITPESLEAQFVLRGQEVRRMFGELAYIVIDELHAFIGSDRGKQLQCLMGRIEAAIDRRVPRIGLSATLGDLALAASYLRPSAAKAPRIIESKSAAQELKVQLRGYRTELIASSGTVPPPDEPRNELADARAAEEAANATMADDLFKTLAGSNNLLFPNSRNRVEHFADLLRRRCEHVGRPNEFWPHHGSLARNIREDTEAALKAGDRPATAICTTTLELGIDIGAVKSVAQIGPPPSVASLRQRLGRSGRRPGEPAILRAYACEHQITASSPLSDRLRESLVQTLASIRLLLARWFEPPVVGGLHLSTLVQQVLSMIAERGGVHAVELSSVLIDGGPFAGLGKAELAVLLRELGRRDLVAQESSGALLLGTDGERRVHSHDFYAAFATREEWQIVEAGRALGTLPIESPVFLGLCIIFGGRRWKILDISQTPPVLTVAPDPSGRPPIFESGRAMVHERVRQEMRAVLEGDFDLGFLDSMATELLHEARRFFLTARLSSRILMKEGDDVLLIPWAGDAAQNALVLLLRSLGMERGSNDGLSVRCEGWSIDRLADACSDVVALSEVDLLTLLEGVENLGQGKWDWALPRALLVRSYASQHLDIPGAKRIAARVLADEEV